MINKILITGEYYYPIHGGIEQYLKYLSRFLSYNNIKVTILTSKLKSELNFFRFPEASVYYSDLLTGSMKNPFSVIKRKNEIASFIEKINPDIVFANNHNSLAVINACKLINKPVIYGCHGVGLMCPRKIRFLKENNDLCWEGLSFLRCTKCYFQIFQTKKLVGFFIKLLPSLIKYKKSLRILDSADARLGNSNLTKNLFRKKDNSFGFPLMIDTDSKKDGFFPDRDLKFLKKFNLKHKNYFLVPGRLNNIKGQEYVIEAMRFLPKDTKLVIAGTANLFIKSDKKKISDYESRIKDLIQKYDLKERVIFTGLLLPNEMRKMYTSAKITIIPSIWIETFGYVTIESMACETPVILTKNCGSAECIDPSTGILVERMNAKELADAVFKIDAKAVKMGKHARKIVLENYSLEILGSRTLAIFNKIKNEKRK